MAQRLTIQLEEITMDLSNHAMLATRLATIALVFSVSSCVLSKSVSEDDQLSGKPESKEVSTAPTQSTEPQKQQGPVNKTEKVAQTNKSNAKNTEAVKPTQSTKQRQVTQQKAARPGTIRATNQKVTQLAVEGKLDTQQQTAKKEIVKQSNEKKVIRYVNVDILNVRMDTSEESPVVGKLTKGTMYHVSINGMWAKIGEGQYVMTKFLSHQPPKRTGSNWTFRK